MCALMCVCNCGVRILHLVCEYVGARVCKHVHTQFCEHVCQAFVHAYVQAWCKYVRNHVWANTRGFVRKCVTRICLSMYAHMCTSICVSICCQPHLSSMILSTLHCMWLLRRLSVCASIKHSSAHPSIHPFINSSVHLSVWPSFRPSVHTSVRPSVHASVRPSIRLSDLLLVHPSV